MKPFIEIADFQHLNLRVGTVVEMHNLGSSLDLVAADVQVEERVAAALPASAASELVPGTRVVVAMALHRLAAGGSIFSAFIVATLEPEIGLADGSRVV